MTAASGCSPPRPTSTKRSNSARTAQPLTAHWGRCEFTAIAPSKASPNASARWRSTGISPTPTDYIGMAKMFFRPQRRDRGAHSRSLAHQPARRARVGLDGFRRNSQVPPGPRRGSARVAQPVDRAQSEFAGNSVLPRRHAGASRSRRRGARSARACLELNPSFTIARFRSQTNSDHPVYLAGRERMYEGLRKAGVPEG